MKGINIKGLLLGIAASFALAIIISILRALLRDFTGTVLFGEAGAYSFEDQQKITFHISVVSFDIVSEIVKVIIPCAIVAKIAKNHEVKNSILMAVILAGLSYILAIDNFGNMANGMFFIYLIVYLILAVPTALIVRRFNNHATSS